MCVCRTAGLTTTGLAAVMPGLPSEPERAGDPSMRDKVVIQWGGAPPLSFSSLLVYRVEYSLAGVFDGSMDSGSDIVSEIFAWIQAVNGVEYKLILAALIDSEQN